MHTIAPEIFRKRLLIEGYFRRERIVSATLVEYFAFITSQLGLRTYAEPIVHETGGQGKADNQGFDAFVPLIDSGSPSQRLASKSRCSSERLE